MKISNILLMLLFAGMVAASAAKASVSDDAKTGSISDIYGQILKDNPDIQGKIVLELVITPKGNVKSVKVISDELKNYETKNDQLRNDLIERIKTFKFKGQGNNDSTVIYPIEFLPNK